MFNKYLKKVEDRNKDNKDFNIDIFKASIIYITVIIAIIIIINL